MYCGIWRIHFFLKKVVITDHARGEHEPDPPGTWAVPCHGQSSYIFSPARRGTRLMGLGLARPVLDPRQRGQAQPGPWPGLVCGVREVAVARGVCVIERGCVYVLLLCVRIEE